MMVKGRLTLIWDNTCFQVESGMLLTDRESLLEIMNQAIHTIQDNNNGDLRANINVNCQLECFG